MSNDAALTPPLTPQQGLDLIKAFLIETGPYTPLQDMRVEGTLRRGFIRFDAFCPGCKRDSIFDRMRTEIETSKPVAPHSAGTLVPYDPPPPLAAYFEITMYCARNLLHVVKFFFLKSNGELIKVGQYPSYADLLVGSLGPDIFLLKPPERRELTKAVRLFSSDASVGGYVYLRRVFERLIQEVYERREEEDGPIDGFGEMPMDKKLRELAERLPRSVADHGALWGILSAGVHELDEETCRRHFPAVRAALTEILHTEAARRRAIEDEKATTVALQAALGELRSKKG